MELTGDPKDKLLATMMSDIDDLKQRIPSLNQMFAGGPSHPTRRSLENKFGDIDTDQKRIKTRLQLVPTIEDAMQRYSKYLDGGKVDQSQLHDYIGNTKLFLNVLDDLITNNSISPDSILNINYVKDLAKEFLLKSAEFSQEREN